MINININNNDNDEILYEANTIDLHSTDNSIDLSCMDNTFMDGTLSNYVDIDTLDINIDPYKMSDLTISRPGKPDIKVGEKLDQFENDLNRVMERLAILQPDFSKINKYPALREAYNNYKLIESMLIDENKDEQ